MHGWGGNLISAVDARIKRANQTWQKANRKIYRIQAFSPQIKIMIWNSLIRSAMVYGLRTRDLPRNLLNKAEAYMCNYMRTMTNHRWKQDEWRPVEKQLYKTLQESTMESWIDKAQITTILTHPKQTPNRYIRRTARN